MVFGGNLDCIRWDVVAVDFAGVEAACCLGIEHFFSLVADCKNKRSKCHGVGGVLLPENSYL